MTDSKIFSELPGVERATVRGLPCVRVTTAQACGLVFVQGAHVAAWVPTGQTGVLWMSEQAVYQTGKPLRGGIPICFPWFGAHAEHQEYPQHGFARTQDFAYTGARLDSAGRTQLEFLLRDSEATRAWFPHAFEARFRVAFGQSLGLEFEVTNRGPAAFSYEEALHTYFAVSDVKGVSVQGLQGATYNDKVRGVAGLTESASELRLSGETDRVYASSATCTIRDAHGARALVVAKQNSGSTVVWNPWSEKAAKMADFGADAWPHMLCIESANVAGAKILLAPEATRTLSVEITTSS